MSRRPLRFTQADISRAVKAVTGLGIKIAEVNIGRDGAIKIVPLDEKAQAGDDAELAAFRAKHGYG
jgi:hypothetical protein